MKNAIKNQIKEVKQKLSFLDQKRESIDKVREVIYNTPVAEGVIGYLREEDVTQAMERIQLLESLPF